ncbi:MAG TPA: ABC transporter substrate-binding protein, partial [bacterium]|nr:ABC transporter substrate-binding protein [bacterium]
MQSDFNLIIVLLLLLVSCSSRDKDFSILTVGMPSEWGNINPPIQYSVNADVIISNQFESLVRVDNNGMIEPLVASSWATSPTFDELRFKIDTSRRFSNGRHLTAMDIKRSWEQGLKMTPKKFNSAFEDLLNLVEGYEDFEKKKTLSGLLVDRDFFIIKFKKPHRAALSYLTNSRMSVFLEDHGRFLGTGKYVVTFNDGKYLEMKPNKYSSERARFSKVKMMVIDPQEA